MQSFHHSRARILFEVACAFGISASCVWAWQQTWSTAMLPAAAIAALYGLVHAFDMVRRSPKVAESVAEPEPVARPAPASAEFVAEVAEPSVKRGRKPTKQKGGRTRRDAEPQVAEFAGEPQPEIASVAVQPDPEPVVVADEPEIAELPPELRIVDSIPDEPEYVPATPLFEPEPFVRQQRAAFGRKAR